MKLHPREKNVREAELKLSKFLIELQKELTPGEYLRVVAGKLSDTWGSTAKYIIREERHPGEPDKPGGLE